MDARIKCGCSERMTRKNIFNCIFLLMWFSTAQGYNTTLRFFSYRSVPFRFFYFFLVRPIIIRLFYMFTMILIMFALAWASSLTDPISKLDGLLDTFWVHYFFTIIECKSVRKYPFLYFQKEWEREGKTFG